MIEVQERNTRKYERGRHERRWLDRVKGDINEKGLSGELVEQEEDNLISKGEQNRGHQRQVLDKRKSSKNAYYKAGIVWTRQIGAEGLRVCFRQE